MSEQPDLFAAIEARDEAIERVWHGAGDTWMREAVDMIARVAATEGEFTTDEVWDALARAGLLPRERRAIGAAMKSASVWGLIKATDRYRPSTRVECHARPVRVWVRTGFTHPLGPWGRPTRGSAVSRQYGGGLA